MAWGTKTCIVCGKSFDGTAKAEVCGGTCRTKLSRMKAKGEQPKFRLIGGKNSKPEAINEPIKAEPKKVIYDNPPPKKLKEIDRMESPFWMELKKKKLGLT